MNLAMLLKRARDSSRREFVAQFRHPLLVVPKTSASEELSFQTQTNLLGGARADQLAAQIGEILEVAKSDRNPFTSRIIVGRVRNCDVVLRHSSVSKMHAQFRQNAGRLTLVHMASRNHTHLNGRPLALNAPAPVELGSVIQFGDIVTQLVDAQTLHEILVHTRSSVNQTG